MSAKYSPLGKNHPSEIPLEVFVSPDTPASKWHVIWRAGGGSLRYGQPPHIRRYTSLKDGAEVNMKMPGSGRTWHRAHGVTGFRAIEAYAEELNRKQVPEPPAVQRRVLVDLPPAKRVFNSDRPRPHTRRRSREELLAEIERLKAAAAARPLQPATA